MNRALHIWLIIALIFITDIAIEIYLPALPNIATFFNASSAVTKLTISFNIIGLAVSGLFYGTLSDKYGRRPIMLIGIVIFCITSFLCVFSVNIYNLMLFRFLQGIGQGVAIVVGYASIRDYYTGRKCAQIISRVSMVVAVSPTFAPILGSIILVYSSWHLIFIILGISGLVILALFYLFFKETLKEKYHSTERVTIKNFALSYYKLLSNKPYAMYGIIAILNFIWLWNVIASVPFLLIGDMGVPIKDYGYLVALNVLGFVIGTILNQIYVVKIGIRKMLKIGLFLPLLTDSLILILYFFVEVTPLMMQLIWFWSALGIAFIIGNATTAALDCVSPSENSKATAILVFLEMILSAIGIYVNSIFYNGTIIPISAFTVVCVAISLIVYYIQTSSETT